MVGLILVRKPVAWTSHDVVAFLRRVLGERRIGHFGTLDPLATGLLLAAVGPATRLFPYFGEYDKTYAARIRLGYATETYDGEGSPTSDECRELPSRDRIEAALRLFEGEIDQLPPPYSAKKHMGKPLYAYARKSQEVERRPSRVTIKAISLRSYDPPFAEAEVTCSSGTYIRSLAHDLGLNLGCGAYLAGLVRTRIGPYRIEDSREPEEIRALRESGETANFLIPFEELLPERPSARLDDEEAAAVRNGRQVRPASIRDGSGALSPATAPGGQILRLFGPDGRFAALARPAENPGFWAPVVVFP